MTGPWQEIRRWAHARFGVRPLAQSVKPLEHWFKGSLGQALLNEEQPQVDRALRDLFGFHLMQLGVGRDIDLTRNSTIHHRFSLSPLTEAAPKDSLVAGVADIEKIPLASESIDVALLHHVLEFSEHPHQLLRETARVLIPRGHVVIVGFNPISWFGLAKGFGRVLTRKTQWRHHALRLGRLVDWLRLLDFEPVTITQGFYRLPIDSPAIMARTAWYERFARKLRLPMGGFFVIVARKDVVAMTPIKPAWRKFNPMEGLVVTRPTTRVGDVARNVKREKL